MTNGRTSNQALPLPAWGIRLESRKVESETGAIKKMPPPGELIVALKQNIGVPAETIVQPGERVLKGQPIAIASRWGLSVAVHAPTSGAVMAIEERPIPVAGGGDYIIGFDELQLNVPASDGPGQLEQLRTRGAFTHPDELHELDGWRAPLS